jgi:hypothetical protein
MKILTKTGAIAIVTSALLSFSNCGSDEPKPSSQEVQLRKLTKTWTIVTINGARLGTTDRTTDFLGPSNFTLTFSGSYNSSNPDGPYDFSVSGPRPTPGPWPVNGKWKFETISENTGTITRTTSDGSDGTLLNYTISSSGQLTLVFECNGCNYPGSRTEQVDGIWTFTFN